MNKTFKKFIVALLIASLFVFPMAGVNGGVQAQDSFPPALEPSLSADGLTLYNGVTPLVVVVDPNPAMQGIKIPAPEVDKALADLDAASATFSFTYVADGNEDPWHQVCTTFPDNAKTAFNAAAAIWASKLQSSVLITIQACWASLSDPNTLGYSGGQPLHRDFSWAPQANTWYQGSLANALYGSDLDSTSFDMYITYNSNFAWYTATDSHPPAGQYDLVTVAAHEIAHGLNFSGSAQYFGGMGSYGYDGYPQIYDTFMEDNGGRKLTSYPNSSAELGTLLTSGSLWFNGSNANAANGGTRVKMYAPPSWNDGSSYGHLDYSTFAGPPNSMMVYAVASGSANHNPGPVTTGLLKDLGWVLAGESTGSTIYLPLVLRNFASTPPGDFNKSAPANGATSQQANPTLSWGASSNATSYEYCIDTSNNNACDTTWASTAASTSVGLSGLTPTTPYYWQVRANNASGTTNADGGTWWSFTTAASPPPGGGIVNGDFESGSTGWTEYSLKGFPIIYSSTDLPITPHNGSYAAWLGGLNDEIAYIQQQVTIPSSTPWLVYWHWIDSDENGSNDFGEVLINGNLEDWYYLYNTNSTGGWVQHSVNLSAYAGQSVKLQIGVETDGSNISNLYVDDVSLQASASALGPIQGVAPNQDASTTQGKVVIVTQGEKP